MAQRGPIAACFSSWQRVEVVAQGRHVRDELREPLRADLFLALTVRDDDNCTTVESCGVRTRLAALMPNVTAMSLLPMMETSDFVLDFERRPHWSKLLQAINATPGKACSRNAEWDHRPGKLCQVKKASWHGTFKVESHPCSLITPYSCTGLRGGNTILAPVIGSGKLHILHQLYDQRQCLRLITAHEQATGVAYGRVLWSRLENVWLLPHPPPSTLDADCTWIPYGENYNGMNDRHALMPRRAAQTYLGRYEMILDGRIMQIARNLRAGRFSEMSEEKFLRDAFAFANLRVCRFPAAAFLTCCTGVLLKRKSARGACNSNRCNERVLPGRLHHAVDRLPRDAYLARDETTRTVQGKYYEEVELAIKQALAYHLPHARRTVQPEVGLAAKSGDLSVWISAPVAMQPLWKESVRSMWSIKQGMPSYFRRAGTKRKAWGVAWQQPNTSAVDVGHQSSISSQGVTLQAHASSVGSSVGRPRRRCNRLRMQRYEPSALEQRWLNAVTSENPTSCAAWLPPRGALHALASATVSDAAQPAAHSHLVFGAAGSDSECGADEGRAASLREPIEPLTSFLRSPRALVPEATPETMFGKEWLVLPGPSVIDSVRRSGGRFIFVDLGAGLFSTGGKTPGAVNGSSLKWFTWRYEQIGVTFDRIIAFEARAFRPSQLWNSMPPSIVERLQYYNVPAEAGAGTKLNPWRILASIARRDDYVVVKLDIDHAATELALVHQLLDPETGMGRLVDEIFWEHHVAGSALCCPKLWRWREPTGLGWARMQFNRSNRDETLAGSYELLTRLRTLGIRAHSWV